MPLTKDQEKRKIPSKTRGDEKRHDENERFEQLLDKLEEITTKGRLKDMAFNFTDTKQIIKSNFIAGMARGVGLTLGTAVFLAIFALIIAQVVNLPMIGEWIAGLVDEVNRYQQ
ncbi:hypothetical protein FLK61_27280 [Paenalkalicoccus suaedae]|uniref:Uncharacterized protein n=1 Tax=Paenalkalicoccus suaedae TaxID=2592382 RepID=A0A859FB18_9BACI|nr:DUF5665 domain-containing protein [Paenalkalicoccus suaedae]QKS70459.1 hypothetical protein FLK61_27280 [Paenalkalicoccus suaedae]